MIKEKYCIWEYMCISTNSKISVSSLLISNTWTIGRRLGRSSQRPVKAIKASEKWLMWTKGMSSKFTQTLLSLPPLMNNDYQGSINPIWVYLNTGNILGLSGVRVPILFGNDLPLNDWPYSKGFMKFGCLEPSKIMFDKTR